MSYRLKGVLERKCSECLGGISVSPLSWKAEGLVLEVVTGSSRRKFPSHLRDRQCQLGSSSPPCSLSARGR